MDKQYGLQLLCLGVCIVFSLRICNTNLSITVLPTGIEVVFSESDYSANEYDQKVFVMVQTEGKRATPVTLQVTPLNYDDFISLDKPLPSGFPDVPSSNDYFDVPLSEITSPNRAMAGQLIMVDNTV